MHRPLRVLVTAAALATVTASTCLTAPAVADPANEPVLQARAVLPAQTFAEGPPSGAALGTAPVNGVVPPFTGQPVQGFSALIEDGRRGYLALSDNGYGAKANSADFLLRAYRLLPDFRTGTVAVRGFVGFSDPHGFAGQPLTRADRQLTGADFDPESLRRVPDGTFWVGEEFGPSLLHFSATGELLRPPVRLPVPDRLAAYGRGREFVTSPDAPELAVPNPAAGTGPAVPATVPSATAAASANLPGSRGVEGMALSTDGRTLYPSLEGALFDDRDQRRRVVYAFDLRTERFAARTADLRLGAAGDAIGDLTAAGPDTLLVIARDNAQGTAARTKDVLQVDISRFTGYLPTTPLVDLLSLSNPEPLVGGPAVPGTVGLGDPFAFPFQTIESLLVQDRRTLVIANDNNFPFSAGRRPGVPDDNEVIVVSLPRPLPRALPRGGDRP